MVPDLTRCTDIKLNARLSLRRLGKSIASQDRTLAALRKCPAKPSGDHTPLGGFVFQGGSNIMILQEHDEENLFERRSIGRTKIVKGASLFFDQKICVSSCNVRDITNVGAGIRVQSLSLLPLTFELSFDNFRTVRTCLLIWRQSEFLGVTFRS